MSITWRAPFATENRIPHPQTAPAVLRAVLFDFDGTLLDSAAEFTLSLNRLRQEWKLPPLSAGQVRPMVSDGARALVRFALELEDDAEVEEQRQHFLEIYAGVLGRDCRLFPGISRLLHQLEQREVPWGIVTNKMEHLARPLLRQLQLHTPVLVCPDHVQHAKPAPEPVLLACRQMQRPVTEVLYVGDHRRDIDAGCAAGVRTAVAGWGYLHADALVHDWGADYVLQDVPELDALLQRLLDGK